MNKPVDKHAVWVTGWYPNKNHQTLGNFVQRHAQAAALYSQITVVVPVPTASKVLSSTITDERSGNLREIRVYYPEWMRIAGAYKALNRGLALIDEKVDCVHGHALISAWWMMKVAAKKFKCPTLLTEHWAGFHHSDELAITAIKKSGMKKMGNRVKYVLPVTRHLGETLKSKGYCHDFSVVGNVVDTNTFQGKTTPGNAEFCRFLHVSTLHDPQKNITGLLRVFKKLVEENPKVYLEIVGDGATSPYIDAAKRMGLFPGHVIVEGEKSIKEIADKMHRANAFVLFSRYENFPCVIAEAWASGIPVIATDVGGISEHLNEENGILVPNEDESALLEAMRTMYSQHSRYNAELIAKYAHRHFGVEAIGKAFYDYYQKC
ncbi:MAG: glycosyltransferase family 4 protein [Cryomorphaceae bacterium]|nr:glycosyltransferase family 4 protein [Cryomorphaceae bacterium]